jgi:IMP dehydrogenase
MSLFFSWKEIKNRSRGLTFDDVLIVPQKSDIRSRRDPSLKTNVTERMKLNAPLISANMDTITEWEMAKAINDLGGMGILHRFLSIDEQVKQVQKLRELGVNPIAASIGVGEEFKSRAQKLVEAGCRVLTIDIAHGHSVQMVETMKWVKDKFSDVELIVGNVATAEATDELIDEGASAIKVGIGPGSMCTTRVITGCGLPQLTAIALCAEVGHKRGIPIIADGGMRSSGDVMKALAAGANCVMLGSMLAATIETPGEIKHGMKQYRGMASRAAQENWRGGVPEGLAPEGEASMIPVKGRVSDVVHEILGGIRSGMSYINAASISEIHQKARFVEMSFNGVHESRAHGVR